MIPIYPNRSPTLKHIDDYLVEDKARDDYRLHRSAFADAALFELEMHHIFKGNWIYLAHDCQIPASNVDGIDGRYRVRRKEPEGRVQTHPPRLIEGGGDAGVWMRWKNAYLPPKKQARHRHKPPIASR